MVILALIVWKQSLDLESLGNKRKYSLDYKKKKLAGLGAKQVYALKYV